jgi:RNA polymerase sigma-70 factor (sigma-E family)
MIDAMVWRRSEVATDASADEGLTALYVGHYRELVRLAALLLDSVETSEEVVQEAYIRAHGAWHRITDEDKALAYLRSTVLNLARSRMRHRLVQRKYAPKPMPDAASAEHGAMAGLERAAVIAALRKLPAKQREAVVLRYYADLSEREIAESMGISGGAVKTHIHRGMAALERHLEALS